MPIRFVKVDGEGVHEIPGRPGPCRHHRAGAFPFLRRRRKGAAPGGAPRLHAQGHREALRGHDAWRRARSSPAASAATPRSLMPGPMPWPWRSVDRQHAAGRALWLRALLLERERIANHLGDLGYLGNDVALSFGFAQFWRLKEDVLRLRTRLFGHRYLMDAIVPGGVACDLTRGSGKAPASRELDAIGARSAPALKDIYDEHAGAAGPLHHRRAGSRRNWRRKLGLTGLAGRASGQAWDLRVDFRCAPYDGLDVRMATHRNGDVAARVIGALRGTFESLRLIARILDRQTAAGRTRAAARRRAGESAWAGWKAGAAKC